MIFKVALMSSKLMTPLNYLRKIRVRRFMKEKFTPTQYSSPNTDAVPHMSATGLLENLGDTSEQLFVRSFKDFVEKKAEAGEWRAYSTTTGATAAAEVWVKSDGSILVQSNKDAGAKVLISANGNIDVSGEYKGQETYVKLKDGNVRIGGNEVILDGAVNVLIGATGLASPLSTVTFVNGIATNIA